MQDLSNVNCIVIISTYYFGNTNIRQHYFHLGCGQVTARNRIHETDFL